jgi:hypothetical protein
MTSIRIRTREDNTMATRRKGESETTKRLRLAHASLERANEVIDLSRAIFEVLSKLNQSMRADRGELPVGTVPMQRTLTTAKGEPVTEVGTGLYRFHTASGSRYMRDELVEVMA